MGADPKPDHDIAFTNADRAVAQSHAGGKDRKRRMDMFELKTRVSRISLKNFISCAGPLLDLGREFLERFSEALVGMGNHFSSGSNGRVRPDR